MQVAVISDIHGNCVALDSALADIRKRSVDEVVCLGDTVQGGAEPVKSIERPRHLACPTVMGNADAWLLNETSSAESTSKEQHEVRAWTISKLSSRDMGFLWTYQPKIEVMLGEGQRLLCFHGSPISYDDILLPDTPSETWDKALGKYAPAIMTGGILILSRFVVLVVDCSSILAVSGLAYDYRLSQDSFHADPWAEYAILSYDRKLMSLSFHRVPYEIEELIRVVRTSGRPHFERMISDYRSG